MYVTVVKGANVPLILYAGPLPCWIMFFVLGVFIGHHPRRRYSIIPPVAILIIGFVLSVLEADYLLDHYGKGIGIKPSAFIYSAGMIFLLFSKRMENLLSHAGVCYRFIVWIGNLSFGIYLIHCYFVSFVVKRLPIDSWILRWALVLLLTALLIETIRKVLPAKCYKYIGI